MLKIIMIFILSFNVFSQVPNNFIENQPIEASKINQNFNYLESLSSNTITYQFSSGELIESSKIQQNVNDLMGLGFFNIGNTKIESSELNQMFENMYQTLVLNNNIGGSTQQRYVGIKFSEINADPNSSVVITELQVIDGTTSKTLSNAQVTVLNQNFVFNIPSNNDFVGAPVSNQYAYCYNQPVCYIVLDMGENSSIDLQGIRYGLTGYSGADPNDGIDAIPFKVEVFTSSTETNINNMTDLLFSRQFSQRSDVVDGEPISVP